MLIALWIINGLLALAFLMVGITKLVRPREALSASGMGWVEDFSGGTVRAIGALEALGALGLILPLLTGIAPVLSPISAVGLVLVMIGAIIVHSRRKEPFVPQIGLLVLAIASAVLGYLVVL
ncbi:DoxX family protein [Homoserinibacter sp. GY 40078]|uniref:DoxX family protein n=1 Tax=Homoserinibacter sp. GY 40078 TaxID=2603275 RepID=UPI0011C9F11C|nr:DoxX family protein [Homoserinibacter sp. GY 40078]TXK19127.1 DoxX family protein [Homoserinibacter sp. GY 40078]